MTWTWDDGRIIVDIVVGSLIAGGLRLIVLKAFIEPAAVWAGRKGYHHLDRLLGNRLPDLP
jgi:hypothetical protein